MFCYCTGAAPGNVAESVILERSTESTLMFVEGAKTAYAGHLTLKFVPDVQANVSHHKHYCLEVGETCSPTIDHCIIRSTSVGTFFCRNLGFDTHKAKNRNYQLTKYCFRHLAFKLYIFFQRSFPYGLLLILFCVCFRHVLYHSHKEQI